ncbi:hypothetical protein [Rhodococcus sp. C3V]|uniref:hypothetical protein n=1 Tax=Rhodococcus sp. C3V TaxID=3034165 RepID=UPI0023E0EEA4|nr:hypothetical protein [Rhodococcus sp. C3V]MDF3316494.1 hypothetical protein [Rhodococcus sp. C3V]
MADLHVIYTSYGDEYGWYLSSPQIPELVGGRHTLPELVHDTPEILRFAGVPHHDNLFVHLQRHFVDPDGDEYLVRVLQDENIARENAVNRLVSGVLAGNDDDLKARQPELVTTERLLIAVIDSDRLGWIEDQLGDASAMLGIYGGDDLLYSIPMTAGKAEGQVSWSFEKLGLSSKSSVADMLDVVLGKEAQSLNDGTRGIASIRHVSPTVFT